MVPSLPVRERGLKLADHRKRCAHLMSLPVRERGLKHHFCRGWDGLSSWSLPVRERGLKRPVGPDYSDRLDGRSPCGSVD